MARKLTKTVYVLDGDHRRHCFGPGDPIPTWARAKITNPQAWETSPRRAALREIESAAGVPESERGDLDG